MIKNYSINSAKWTYCSYSSPKPWSIKRQEEWNDHCVFSGTTALIFPSQFHSLACMVVLEEKPINVMLPFVLFLLVLWNRVEFFQTVYINILRILLVQHLCRVQSKHFFCIEAVLFLVFKCNPHVPFAFCFSFLATIDDQRHFKVEFLLLCKLLICFLSNLR